MVTIEKLYNNAVIKLILDDDPSASDWGDAFTALYLLEQDIKDELDEYGKAGERNNNESNG